MQETKLQGSVCLSLCLVLGLCNVHELSQVMYGHLDVAILGVDVGEKFVSLTLLVAGARLHLALTYLEEACQTCNSLVQVTKLLMNKTDSLVALSLLFLLIRALTGL